MSYLRTVEDRRRKGQADYGSRRNDAGEHAYIVEYIRENITGSAKDMETTNIAAKSESEAKQKLIKQLGMEPDFMRARDMGLMNDDGSEIQEGIAVEAEHADLVAWLKEYATANAGQFPPDTEIFAKIAEAHLSEDAEYYKKLASCVEGERTNAGGVEYKGYTIEKVMGMFSVRRKGVDESIDTFVSLQDAKDMIDEGNTDQRVRYRDRTNASEIVEGKTVRVIGNVDERGSVGKVEIVSGDTAKLRFPSGATAVIKLENLRIATGLGDRTNELMNPTVGMKVSVTDEHGELHRGEVTTVTPGNMGVKVKVRWQDGKETEEDAYNLFKNATTQDAALKEVQAMQAQGKSEKEISDAITVKYGMRTDEVKWLLDVYASRQRGEGGWGARNADGKKYRIVKTFDDGTTYTEVTTVPFKKGERIDKPIGGKAYTITESEEVVNEAPIRTDQERRADGQAAFGTTKEK